MQGSLAWCDRVMSEGNDKEDGRTLLKIAPVETEAVVVGSWAEK